MNWDAIGAIGEIVGAIAVFGTLMYLAVQVKQVQVEVQSVSHREINRMFDALNASVSQSPELAKVLAKADEDVSSLEQWEIKMLDSYLFTSLNAWEFVFGQINMGLLTNSGDEVLPMFRNSLDQPWVPSAWKRIRADFHEEVQEFVDEQLGGRTD